MIEDLLMPFTIVVGYDDLENIPCVAGQLAIINGEAYLCTGTSWEAIGDSYTTDSGQMDISYRVKITHCPDCGAPVKLDTDYCPWCGVPYPKECE